MKLRQTILALPGDHLADVSPELAAGDAANLLACWTALWHPSLLAQARQVPRCEAADKLIEQDCPPDTLVLIPEIAQSDALTQWVDQWVDQWEDQEAEEETAKPLLTRKIAQRREIIALLQKATGIDLPSRDAISGEFYAFGYAYLQVEVLTRAMHHEPLVSQSEMSEAIVAAADAALAGDAEALETKLADAYDLLMQARNHYYPIDFYLLDLSLLAPATCGKALADHCQQSSASNYLLTGEVLGHIATNEPASLAALREALATGGASICGGSLTSTPLADLGPEALLEEMLGGLAKFDEHLNRRPALFAHPCGPLAPLVPGVLEKLGYTGALTANFAGERLPTTTATRATWVGLDGSQVEALNTVPLDMGNASTLLGLSNAMSGAMDYDLAATLLLVGWPGHRCEFYDDLMRVAQRSTVLGRLISLDEYFDVTTSSDYAGTIVPDDYPGPTGQRTADTSVSARLASLAQFAGAEPDSKLPAEQLATLLGTTETAEGTLHLNGSSSEWLGLPGFGWRWVPAGETNEGVSRAEPGVLRNEAMEVWFDEATGGISAVRLHDRRGNLLSQQLVLSSSEGYQIAMDPMEVVTSDSACGVIASASRIVDAEGQTVANLRQTTTLRRDSHRIEVEVELTPIEDRPLPLTLASRMAFRDPSATLHRGVQGVNLPTAQRQVKSEWLQVAGEPVPIAIVCGQLRTHRRTQEQWIDTVLFEKLESFPSQCSQVRLSYVIDCEFPALVAAEQEMVAIAANRPTQPAGWWLRVATRNVQVTHLAVEQSKEKHLLRLRVLETAGRQVKTTLAAWCPFVEARFVDFRGQPDQPLTIKDGTIALHLAAYEWVEMEAVW